MPAGPKKKKGTRVKWTKDEDNKLREAIRVSQKDVLKPNEVPTVDNTDTDRIDWKHISQESFDDTKTALQCRQRWATCGDTKRVTGKWTAAEDATLTQAVLDFGAQKWTQIAARVRGRNGKQCRERWHHHLNPEVRKGEWSDVENRFLIKLHTKHGNKWALLSSLMKGRSDNDIKNHWNSSMLIDPKTGKPSFPPASPSALTKKGARRRERRKAKEAAAKQGKRTTGNLAAQLKEQERLRTPRDSKSKARTTIATTANSNLQQAAPETVEFNDVMLVSPGGQQRVLGPGLRLDESFTQMLHDSDDGEDADTSLMMLGGDDPLNDSNVLETGRPIRARRKKGRPVNSAVKVRKQQNNGIRTKEAAGILVRLATSPSPSPDATKKQLKSIRQEQPLYPGSLSPEPPFSYPFLPVSMSPSPSPCPSVSPISSSPAFFISHLRGPASGRKLAASPPALGWSDVEQQSSNNNSNSNNNNNNNNSNNKPEIPVFRPKSQASPTMMLNASNGSTGGRHFTRKRKTPANLSPPALVQGNGGQHFSKRFCQSPVSSFSAPATSPQQVTKDAQQVTSFSPVLRTD